MILRLSSVITFLLFQIYFTFSCDANNLREKAHHLFNEFWEWRLVNNPRLSTKLGSSQYDDRMAEMSLSSYKRRADEVRFFLKRADELSKETNGTKDSELLLDIDLLRNNLQQYLSGLKFMPYLYPLNHMEGPHNENINLVMQMKRSTESDMINILSRLRLFSQQIDEIITLLKEGIRLGLTMNRRSFENLGSVYERFASGNFTNNPFFAPFQKRPKTISTSVWNHILEEADVVVRQYIQPSYKRLKKFLMYQYLPKSRPQIGVSSLPNGIEYYKACIRFHTTTNLSPQEIHNIGLNEVIRITNRMEQVKKQVHFNGTLDQFRSYLRTSDKFGFHSEKEMMSYYRVIKTIVKRLIPKYIKNVPTIPLEIKPVPAHLAPTAAFAFYEEPSADGSRPGIFYVNTYKVKKRRKYVAVSLFCHEGIPGHHIQIASKLQFGPSVSFRRYAGLDALNYEVPATFAANNAYIEGWGLYSEYLGEEMGLYESPYDLFGRLSQEMLRAARLVIDTGIHAFGWSREKAVKFMAENTAGNLHDITSEIDRYITWPGQACAYKIGEMKIKELRKLGEKRLGSKFDVRDFHNFIISVGNIPLTVLEKQFNLYLKKKMEEN